MAAMDGRECELRLPLSLRRDDMAPIGQGPYQAGPARTTSYVSQQWDQLAGTSGPDGRQHRPDDKKRPADGNSSDSFFVYRTRTSNSAAAPPLNAYSDLSQAAGISDPRKQA